MNTCLMLRNSWGWGGVGWDVLTFVAHEHMFDATQLLPCSLVCSRFSHPHTCSMLRNCCVVRWMLTFLASAHMFRATQYCGVVRWDSYLDANLRISLCIFGDVQSSSSQCAWSRSSRFFEFEQ